MDYRSMVNPTYLTAKSTLFMLASAGNEDAKGIIGALGTQDELVKNNRKVNQSPLTPEQRKALMAGASLAVEARYASLSRYIRDHGYVNLLDIACGYTPRAIYCASTGIDYVGVDVPVVAEELQALAEKLGIGKGHPVYVGGDATNAASLKAAADHLTGRVLISCEGLLGYLSADEFEQFLGGVREILLSHGGAWVSSDPGVDYEAFSTANMGSADAVRLYNEAKRQAISASNIYNDGVSHWEKAKLRGFLEAHGFRVEEAPFYCEDDDLALLHGIPEAWVTSFKGLLNASHLWVMTVDEGFADSRGVEGAKQVENLSIDFAKKNGALLCRVNGRIDTISAPALLEVIEANSEGITALKVDAANLEYISSAGLRVLMIAVKKLGPGAVSVTNASEAVREIFETTGFDQMISVE